jgi:outer membrane protein TolC
MTQRILVWIFILTWTGAGLIAQQSAVRIGVVFDGPSERGDAAWAIFEREIRDTLQRDYDVQFPSGKLLVGDWSADSVKPLVDRLMADPEVDLVLAMGILGSDALARSAPLDKPGFAAFVADPRLQDLPYEERQYPRPPPEDPMRAVVSGAGNLSYITIGLDLREEVEKFREVALFSRLDILVMDAWAAVVPDLEANLRSALAPLQLQQVRMVRVGPSVESALANLPGNAEAVYVVPLLQFSSSEFQRLVEQINQRRLPSFSAWGKSEVEVGLLAAVGPADDTLRRARQIALNIYNVLAGDPAAEIAVEFERAERLSINMETARLIGVWPPFKTLLEADLLNDERQQAGRTLSLSAVVREASTVNLDLAVSERKVAAGEGLVKLARSALLPQARVSAGATYIDDDLAPFLPGIGAQRYTASVSGSQLIYSDRVWANYSIRKNLQDFRQEEREQVRLDVILEAAESYLNVLRAKTAERIQKQNLELTRTNLELARSRVDIGVAGREEVFRWESQIARNKQEVIQAQAVRKLAEYAVNRVLNRPQDQTFLTVESTLGDPELVTSFSRLGPYIESEGSLGVFEDFMVAEAFAASPELGQLDALVKARERAVKAARRAFYVPDVGVVGGFTGAENRGAGSEPIFSGLNETEWVVALKATLPIFEGGGRWARREQTRAELEEASLQRDAIRERIEQRMRSILEKASASFVSIDLTQASAAAARRNLGLVTDLYAQGVRGILTLLDAQNFALTADLVAANATFEYLIDLMGAQRAVGRFDYYRSAQGRQDFLNRVDQFFRQQGFPVRNR